jgi:hypothetical protein
MNIRNQENGIRWKVIWFFGEKKLIRSYVVVPSQPVSLGPDVPVHDIALFILKTPGRDDQHIAFPDPGTALHLPFDSSHPGDAIGTPDTYVVGPEHQFSKGKLFAFPFFGQPHANGWSSIGIHGIRVRSSVIIFCVSHATNLSAFTMAVDTKKVCIHQPVFPVRCRCGRQIFIRA